MKYSFRATRAFWRSFAKLPPQQQESARETFRIFKANPFDPRLRSHKIHKLSARYGRIIYAAEIEANLRVVFYIEGNVVTTIDTDRTISTVDGYFPLNSSAPLRASMWTVWPSRTLPSRMSTDSGSRISFWIVRRSGRAP